MTAGLSAAPGGLDALVFTGSIGEATHRPPVGAKVRCAPANR
jgi:hypothetical protein